MAVVAFLALADAFQVSGQGASVATGRMPARHPWRGVIDFGFPVIWNIERPGR